MRHAKPLLMTAAMLAAISSRAWAGNFKIIANPSVKANAVTTEEMRGVFLEERLALRDGSHVEPVLAKAGNAHTAFLKEVMGRSNDALQTYYRTLVFTGKGSMPKEMNSDTDVLAYVARTRGAVGYVSSSASTDNVKVLQLIDQRDQGERRLLTRVEPAYPETLQKLQIGGTVRLSITISPKGTVESAAVLGGNPILAEEAEKAVKQWIYAPGPSRTTMEVTIPFGANH